VVDAIAREKGAVASLVALTTDHTAGATAPAAYLLKNLAGTVAAVAEILEADGAAALVSLARMGGTSGAIMGAASALTNLAHMSVRAAEAIVAAGGVAPLVRLIRDNANVAHSTTGSSHRWNAVCCDHILSHRWNAVCCDHILGAPKASGIRSIVYLRAAIYMRGTPGIFRMRCLSSLSQVATIKQRCTRTCSTMSSSA